MPMRRISIALLAMILCGCGIAERQAQDNRIKAAQEVFRARLAECNRNFPTAERSTAMTRAHCVNDAFAILLPIAPYPDLLQALMTYRLAVLEQFQNGKITAAQANAVIAQKMSELTAEENNRALIRNTMIAQQQAAQAQTQAAQSAGIAEDIATWNAIRPHTCTYGAGMATCF
jgi:hypothetical protein